MENDKQRVHYKAVSVHRSKGGLRRAAKRLETKIQKVVATLPGGSYAAIFACNHQTRRGTVRVVHKVVGTHGMRQFFEKYQTEALATRNAPEEEELMDVDLHGKFLSMPGNAERRAEKLRSLLKIAWTKHVEGTAFEGSRQMYDAVNKKGAPPFSWWDEVTGGAAFTNTAVADPRISQKVFEYLGPKLYEDAVGATLTWQQSPVPNDTVPVVVPCKRHMYCTRDNGHRGKCRVRVPERAMELSETLAAQVVASTDAYTTAIAEAAKEKKKKKKKQKAQRELKKAQKKKRKMPVPVPEKRLNRRHDEAARKKAERLQKHGYVQHMVRRF